MKNLALIIGILFALESNAAYVKNELLVKIKDGSESSLAEVGVKVMRRYELVPGLMLVKTSTRSLDESIRQLEKIKTVEYAVRNHYRQVSNGAAPSAMPILTEPAIPAYQAPPAEWNEDRSRWGNYGLSDNRTHEVWKKFGFHGDAKTVIAVIDTGTDYTHRDLVQNLWRNPGEIEANGIDDDGNGYIDDIIGWDFVTNDNLPYDDYDHGTHVAGIAAAVGGNGIDTAGHCPRCSIMSLKFISQKGGTDADAIRALEYAVKMGAHVINSSWGGREVSEALHDAFQATAAAGVINVIAAGNSAEDLNMAPMFPAKYKLAGGMTVAALYTTNIYMPWWSNYGRSFVHTSTAGSDVVSTVPGGGLMKMSGTSMAAPGIAGCAALIKSRRPDLTSSQVVELFRNNFLADKDSRSKTMFGGRPDMLKIFGKL